MRRLGQLLALVLTLAATVCRGDEPTAPRDVFFPTVPLCDDYPAALIEGVLEVRSGCVFVSRHEEHWLLLWPEGYSVRRADGQIEVLGDGDEVVGREGEPLRLGGGEGRPIEMGGEAAAERWASELTGMDIPERCGDLYWIVSPQ